MNAVRIYNSDHVKVAELENAKDVGFDLYIDRLWTAKFTLPFNDDKREHCELLNYAEIYDGQKRVGLFRIMVEEIQHDKRGKPIRYKCEHVLGSLNSDVIPGIISRTGIANALGYILSQQAVVNWQLGTLDLSGNYEYRWENRSLLYALLDIPTQQKADYQFTFDTTTYPWTVNLVTPSSTPQANVDYGRNLKYIKRTRDIGGLVTRLYAYGFGLPGTVEEVTIETVNPTGNKYIESNTDTYGVVSKTWKDQRFSDPTMLYNAAVELLARLDQPKTTYSVDAMDVYQLIGVDELNLGDYIQITDDELGIDVQQRLVRLRKDDITKSPGGDTIMVLAHKERQLSYGDAAYANDLDAIIGGMGYKPVMDTDEGYAQNLWSPTDRYPNIYIGTETRGEEKTPRLEITDEENATVERTTLLKSAYLALKHITGAGFIRGKFKAHGSMTYNGTRYYGVLELHGKLGHVLLAGDAYLGRGHLIGHSPAYALIMSNIALEKLTAAPTSPYIGMLAYADGATWDPGYGQGVYQWYGSTWNYMNLDPSDCIGGDGTAGRILKACRFTIADGTNANTLKCTMTVKWNGDTILATDNIAKGATTGDFTLDANGEYLTVEVSGLVGNCLYARASVARNFAGTDLTATATATANDIVIGLFHSTTGAIQDMTALVDVGVVYLEIFYITDA